MSDSLFHSQKTSKSLKKPMSEFPTLPITSYNNMTSTQKNFKNYSILLVSLGQITYISIFLSCCKLSAAKTLDFDISVKVKFLRNWSQFLYKDQAWSELQLVHFIHFYEFFKYLDQALKAQPFCRAKSKMTKILNFESSVKVKFLRDWPQFLDHIQAWSELQLIHFV